ncbi:MAG TPA: flagellar motor stator protein MotA [Candidatus Baltobacteraceae bacterium]|jgi:chemotaxis protein MotA|nr:flagellar motor stator protein MotA [Candidatus Baltobacteraceae bacterium]
MIVILGALIVLGSVMGGFVMGGGHPLALMHLSEFVIIVGAALGALVVMSPKKVLVDLGKQIIGTLRGTPYNRDSYNELFKALYELFMLGRRNGMVALEEHVMNPETSAIFGKYPAFQKNHHAIDFLCNGLRPIIDGKIKPDQLKLLLEIELNAMEEEHEKPVNVLTKAADAMPGFGIVAAVLGIVITMASIAGPIEQIGERVAAALVGTFLGIFLSYGFMNPLAVNMEFVNMAHDTYIRCIAASVIGFANGMSPIMAVEVARRGLSSDVKPTSDDLETMLKSVNQAPAR